jgi:hypothetical protein
MHTSEFSLRRLTTFSGYRLEEESKARAIERARKIDAEAFENAPQQTTIPDDGPKKDTKREHQS